MSREEYALHASYASSSASRSNSRPVTPVANLTYDIESLSSDDSASTTRRTFAAPVHYRHHNNSPCYSTTSAYHSPVQSRSNSPSPYSSQYFASEDDQPFQPLLRSLGGYSDPVISSPPRRKWATDEYGRRVRRRHTQISLTRRVIAAIVRHPLFPSSPSSILLTVTAILLTALAIVLLLMYILNPDKYALPWRSYCALSPPFSADEVNKHPPVGIFVGVMSTDSAVERRMLIRSTWAKHARSRGTDGGTDRTIVRFILGIPSHDWMRRIQLESETYRDIVLLPVTENMNNGKTHAYIEWAHANAFVPPPISWLNQSAGDDHLSPYNRQHKQKRAAIPLPKMLFPSFDEERLSEPPPLAPHDPRPANTSSEWVRPQFVIKADDDSFVMLSELQARLRLEWYEALSDAASKVAIDNLGTSDLRGTLSKTKLPMTSSAVQLPQRSTTWVAAQAQSTSTVTAFGYDSHSSQGSIKSIDPMIYWGYLVKARFMAGELYALSSALVEYIATDPNVASMVRGKEDKLTARWLRMHPRATEVRWRSERCWIYDHPRAGTVYSHGFLFPSEVARIRHETTHGLSPAEIHLLPISTSTTDPSFTHSTVSKFGYPYVAPSSNLTTDQEVEALIEGSPLSRLRDETVGGGAGKATMREVVAAWRRRETREKRMGGTSLGGTIVVHFIKRNEWFLETAIAFLHDEPKDESHTSLGPVVVPDPSPAPDNMRVETDLNNKVPIDLSNVDPPGSSPSRIETDLSNHTPIDLSHVDDYPAPPREPDRVTSDLQHKTPIDLSHLDSSVEESPVQVESSTEPPSIVNSTDEMTPLELEGTEQMPIEGLDIAHDPTPDVGST